MFGVFLSFISGFFEEVAISIGKDKANKREISIYTMGILNSLIVALLFVVVGLVRHNFVFSFASLPTLITRIALEIILVQIMLVGVYRADRSTYGFIRVLTVPLLLLVDLFLGYEISRWQIGGIVLIIFSTIFIFYSYGIKKQGAYLALASAILAVATISLYKYDITHYNSVEAEQAIVCTMVISYLSLMSFFVAKENPFLFFKRPIFLIESSASAAAGFLNSFAYTFAPASVILSAYRSAAVLWSVVSGNIYFKEKKLLIKIFFTALLIVGLILLVF